MVPPETDRGEGGDGVLRRSWWGLLLLFAALLLPLWIFGALAGEVHQGKAFAFDQPLLVLAHGMHGAAADRVFLFFSAIGYSRGVVPFDIALVLGLLLWRKRREGVFAGLALGGSGLLNMAAKRYFGRARPALWESIAPEVTYSFPSAHAMGSMTLAAVLVLLTWRTRWRWPVLVAMGLFVAMVGVSRVYLGVHYPSDILAGWTAAVAWTVGVYILLFRGPHRPWREAAA